MPIYRCYDESSKEEDIAKHDCMFEGVKFLDDTMKNLANTKDLYDQWRKVADSFVKHKWIYRYIDEKQKAKLEEHYEVLCNEDSSYAAYKKSFKYICKFMGLPNNTVIIEKGRCENTL